MTTYSRKKPGSRFKRGRGTRGQKKAIHIDYNLYIKKANPKTQKEYVNTHTFEDFDVHPAFKKILKDKGFTTPSPIQDQAIPLIIEGKDIIGLANTGTGKTLAFLLPLVDKVLRKPREEKVLIIAPTRELALQIEQELNNITLRDMRIFSTCCVGGSPIYRQIERIKKFPNQFIIGTPGRLIDLAKREVLDLKTFNNIVLDEADHMVDMGFIGDIKEIIAQLNEHRQSLFFSATLEKNLEPLAMSLLKNPVKITVIQNATSDNVDQDVVHVERDENKLDVLTKILEQKEVEKVVIFANTKHMSQKIADFLYKNGFAAQALHGDKRLNERKRILFDFKKGDLDVLVATDVAARGLDIPNVSHVINYDEPQNYEYYTHRIGRTGRGGKTGKALTLVQKNK